MAFSVYYTLVSPTQLPTFSIDIFKTVSRFDMNKEVVLKGMTVLSLFDSIRWCCEITSFIGIPNMEENLQLLHQSMSIAISNHNLFLLSIIVYILSAMDIQEDGVIRIKQRSFFQDVRDYLSKEMSSKQDTVITSAFANTIYYSLGFFLKHIHYDCK